MKNSRISISIKLTSFLLSVILVAGLLVVAPLPVYAEDAALNVDEGISESDPPAAEGEEPEDDGGPVDEDGDDAAPGDDKPGGDLGALAIKPTDVCAIGTDGYATLADAVAAVPLYNGDASKKRTIKMLKDLEYHGILEVDNRHVTLDLNGKRVNSYSFLSSSSPYHGLYVHSKGALLLKDPYNGELIVSTRGSTTGAAGVYCASGGKAEVTSVLDPYGQWPIRGAHADGAGSEITVYGNVKINSVDGFGVYADAGGKITVEGEIIVPVDATYIYTGANRLPGSFDEPSSTPGYRMYTSNAADPNALSANTVRVKYREPVCEVTHGGVTTQYTSIQAAIFAAPYCFDDNSGDLIPANTRTIKILKSHDIETGNLEVYAKHITLDLNGMKVNVIGDEGYGIYVNGGWLLIADPYDGELNVKTGVKYYSDGYGYGYGIYCTYGEAEASSVAMTGVGEEIYGAQTDFSGKITVYGDVTISSANGIGVQANRESKITVEGSINVPAGATYISLSDESRSKDEYDRGVASAPKTARSGYFQYSSDPDDPDDPYAITVWVREPDAIPVCKVVETGREYFDVQSAIDSAPNYYVDGIAAPANARTIRMLMNYSSGGLVVSDKMITLDLNGYTLNAHNPSGHGLSVQGSMMGLRDLQGSLLLEDPYNGQFNVSTGSDGANSGVYCNIGSAEVSSAKATNIIGGIGAQASAIGDAITVFGDVTMLNSTGFGARASSFSSITVEGAINVPAGAAYIRLGTATRDKDYYDQAGGVPASSKRGYLQYSNTQQARVWVHNLTTTPVCEVVGQGLRYDKVEDAIDAVPEYYIGGTATPANKRTIKMLKNYESGWLGVGNQHITLDLSGYTLNANNSASNGLYVYDKGEILLKNPHNGSFNVLTGGAYNTIGGVYCYNGGKAEVSSAAATNSGGTANGVYAAGADSEITVYGDVTVNSASGCGARTDNGGKVTMEGEINVQAGATYVSVGGANRNKGDHDKSGTAPDTAKPGYLQYSVDPNNSTDSGVNTVWVRDPNVPPVCEIVETGLKYCDVQAAIEAAPEYNVSDVPVPANKRTFKMLRNYDSGGLVVNNKHITLDLSGYTLNADGGTELDGLWVQSNGAFLLKDPYNGSFNISTGSASSYYAGVYCISGGKAEVSSATATNNSGSASGVYIYGTGSEVTVYGDVTTNNESGYGVRANDGGKATIEGEIQVPGGATYIFIVTNRNKGDIDKIGGVPTTAKTGYLQYSNNFSNPFVPVARAVWVRDPAVAFMPVADIRGVPEEMAAGAKLTLSGSVLPSFATGKTIAWSLLKAGTTGASLSGSALTAPNAGSLTVRATVANGTANGIAFAKDFDIEVKKPAHLISVTPTHAILANPEDSAVFEAILASEPDASENYAKIVWSLAGADGSPPANLKILSSGKGRSVTVGATDAIEPLTEQTITVKAVLEGKYIATATVEILPYAGDVTARLLESKATVNKVKDVGALVPVLITKQAPGNLGLTTFSLPVEPLAAGSVVIDKVELFTQNKTTKAWNVPAAGYKARMYGLDDRYIAIDAVDNTAKNVTVWAKFTLKGGAVVADPGNVNKIALTATEKYPKITLKAEGLNLAFPDKGAALTATSNDGACTVVSATPAKAADRGKVVYGGGALSLGSAMKKTGTVSISVEVKVAGYKKPYKTAPKVNVKVANTQPKLKLSPSSVRLFTPVADSVKIGLVSGNKTPFESGYTVKEVVLARVDAKGKAVAVTDAHLDMHYSAGIVSVKLKDSCPSGKSALLMVSFVNGAKPVYLPLKITLIGDASKLTLSSKTKSATVNTGAAGGAKIADIPITLNVANHTLSDWDFTNVPAGSALDKAITLTPGRNSVTLSVKDPKALSDLLTASGGNRKHTLKIGSPGIKTAGATGATKTISFSLTVTKKAGAASISMKNKIDIANPASAITATVKPANTSSDIAAVRILTGAAQTSAVSPDFQAVGVSGKTFRITAAHKQVVPNVAQKVYVHVTLKDGQPLPARLVTIKPAQTNAKAALSKKAVTLYKADPLRGETGSFGLTTPANVKLGAVRLHEGTLKGHKLVHGTNIVGADPNASLTTDGFRIAQSGASHWSLHFADAIAPKALGNKGKVAHLKSSYTLKVELWAEGTYRLDASGKPVALQAYDAKSKKWVNKSKPTVVNVKVSIK